MTALGKNDEIGPSDSFSDLMLKEWATERLLVSKAGSDMKSENTTEVQDSDIFRAIQAASEYESITPGSLLRASTSPNIPFLLKDQLFHKSTILFLQEEESMSVGVILNIPTMDAYSLRVNDKYVDIPIRYGGPSGKLDEQPLLFFHNNKLMKEEKIGRPVGKSEAGMYVCTADEVVDALEDNLAVSGDIFAVQGFCAWEKEMGSGGAIVVH